MKISTVFFGLIFIFSCSGPSSNQLIPEFEISESQQFSVIGVSSYFDDEMFNQKYTFRITDDQDLKSLKDSLMAGSKQFFLSPDDFPFHVFMVSNKEIIRSNMTFHPSNQMVQFNDGYYSFNPEQLTRLNKKYPFNYSVEHLEFSNQSSCDSFIESHLKDDRLVAYEDVTSTYEGEAILYINSDEFMTYMGGRELIESITRRITTSEEECIIGYVPSANEKQKYEYVLISSEEVYNAIQDEKIEKTEWIKNKISLYAFWDNDTIPSKNIPE